MRLRSWFFGVLAGSLIAGSVFAGYDANTGGVVTDVLVYTDSNVILFKLANQPASHPACTAGFFALDSAISEQRLSRLYARLLSAKASGEAVNIGYDSVGNCAHGYIRAHRVG